MNDIIMSIIEEGIIRCVFVIVLVKLFEEMTTFILYTHMD
jgi:hypothetical protein